MWQCLVLVFKKMESYDKSKRDTCLFRYLHLANPNPKRIKKANKHFAKNLDFNKEIKFPVKARDIQKSEKNNSVDISVFSYKNKEKHLIMYQKC